MPEEVAAAVNAGAVLRRAPFSDNPKVGARGRRTHQRILDAALLVFGEAGYHRCTVDGITKAAGCSRVSFYQYFESKEDVHRHLAGRVAQQLSASTDRLGPVAPDAAGWSALRRWVGSYAETYARYEPVFHALPAAHRHATGLSSKLGASPLAPRHLDDVIAQLHGCLERTLDDVSMLRAATPGAFPERAMLDAYTDVFHRTLFGLLPDVNVHVHRRRKPPKLPFGPIMRAAFDERNQAEADIVTEGSARGALLDAAHSVFATRGYHGTRVDDIVEAAGVSHGAFYRYFRNKDELAYLLAARAMRTVSAAFLEMPDGGQDGSTSRTELRRWLRAYNRAFVNETAIIRVWIDAALQDDSLPADSASFLDWGRRRMARVLETRDFGDADTDAVVLLALVDAFGGRERSSREVDATAHIIERGFLGR